MKLNLIYILCFFCNISLGLELIVPIKELSKYSPVKKHYPISKDNNFDPLRIDLIRAHEKEYGIDQEANYLITIKNALKEKSIEGIVFGRGGFDGKVLIGGHVFSPADELLFVNKEGEVMSISPERSVILLSIKKDRGVFLVSGKNMNPTKGEREGVEFEIHWEEFFKL